MGEESGEQGGPSRPASTKGRRAYALYTVVEGDAQSFWRRVGTGWANRDGTFNLFLDALPVNGRLHMREVENPLLGDERL